MADSDGGLLGREVTRRDVVNATLIGAGAALLDGCAPTPKEAVDPWTGPGGVGDYADANGNTAAIVRAAHGIRDGDYEARIAAAVDTGETVDMLIVGGGFGGLGAMLAFKARHPTGTCLLLDNQAVIGGYAKANAFDVDGHRITGAQASMNFTLPTDETRGDSYWPELGLPDDPRWVSRTGGDPAIVVQRSTSGTLYHGEQSATMGYHGARGWAKDMWRDDLATAPIDPAFQRSLLTLRDLKRRGRPTGAEALRLDAMTFADYARELKLDPAVLPYVTLGMCQTGPQVSAYAALSLPGIDRYAPGSAEAVAADRFVAFPGGNAAIARHFVKALVPDAIGGPRTTEGIANGRFDPAALDRRGARLRLRSGALVVRVAHDGDPATAGAVAVTYAKDGKLFRVRAKAVVMTTGQWVTKHVVADLPETHRAALDRFLFAPMLVINVALRNWRFLDRLGFAAARWFDGFGFYATIRQPMALGDNDPPFGPEYPIVMTFYVPIQNPDLPLEAQGPAGRQQLYATSYADYERRLVAQMTRLFAAGGFDARRDIAGIVLNRWGHAFVTPGPGFLLGRDGQPPPAMIARRPYGRIAFGSLEDWLGSAHAGKRAVDDLAHAL